MKRQTILLSFALFLLVLGLGWAGLLGCDLDSPSPTGTSVAPGQSQATLPSTPEGNGGSPNSPSDPVFPSSLKGDKDTMTGVVRNDDEVKHIFHVACFEDGDKAPGKQKLFSSSIRPVPAGRTFNRTVQKPCGPWQCDLAFGNPPDDGKYNSRILLAKHGTRVCSPPPKPPVCTDCPPPPPPCDECEIRKYGKCKPDPRCDDDSSDDSSDESSDDSSSSDDESSDDSSDQSSDDSSSDGSSSDDSSSSN